MQVLFLQTVKGVGKKDELREVSDGYALNFLIPNKKAIRATAEVIAARDTQKITEGKAREHQIEKVQSLLKQLEGKAVSLSLPKNEKGQLYQAVHEQEIVNHVKKAHDLFIPKDLFKKPFPTIKHVGKHHVPLAWEHMQSFLIVEIV